MNEQIEYINSEKYSNKDLFNLPSYEHFRQSDGKFYYVYKTINKISGKYYIGRHQTKNVINNYFGSGIALNEAIKKYNKENFEKQFLGFYSSFEESVKAEQILVNEDFVSLKDNYNCVVGGLGNWQNIGLVNGRNAYFLKRKTDKVFNKSVTDKMVKHHIGSKRSEKTKQLFSIQRKGKIPKNKGCIYITKDDKNMLIKKEELDNYIKIGWIKRKFKRKNKLI